MDPERRKEIAARRDAARYDPRTERGPHVKGPIIPALRERDVPHEAAPFGIWTPPWLKVSGSGVLWDISPPADIVEMYRRSDYHRYPPLPGEYEFTLALRAEQVAEMIWLVAEGKDRITFAYNSQHTGVIMAVEDALPVLDILLPLNERIYIWGLPNVWLIESDDNGWTMLSLKPEPDAEAIHRRQLREAAYAAPLASVVGASGGSLSLWSRENAAAPHQRRPLDMQGWKEREKSLKAMVERGDIAGLEDEVRPWLEARAPVGTMVLVDLRHEESPLIEIAADTLLDNFVGVTAQLNHWEEEPETGLVTTNQVVIHSDDAAWRLYIYPTGPYWRAEGAD